MFIISPQLHQTTDTANLLTWTVYIVSTMCTMSVQYEESMCMRAGRGGCNMEMQGNRAEWDPAIWKTPHSTLLHTLPSDLLSIADPCSARDMEARLNRPDWISATHVLPCLPSLLCQVLEQCPRASCALERCSQAYGVQQVESDFLSW